MRSLIIIALLALLQTTCGLRPLRPRSWLQSMRGLSRKAPSICGPRCSAASSILSLSSEGGESDDADETRYYFFYDNHDDCEERRFFLSGMKSMTTPKKPFEGIITDFQRRKPYYMSDWTDGFRRRSVTAIFFMYVACLAPVVAFGGITDIITDGAIGVIEFIVSCGASGAYYAIFSGQPMAFVGPTGLTLAFTAALYRFTIANSIPFMPMFSWTGIWTSVFLALSAVFNLSDLIQYCTRFTDDCFNALLAINFLYEAVLSLARNFTRASTEAATALVSMNMALATWTATSFMARFRKTKYISYNFRKWAADLGPTMVILIMSFLAGLPSKVPALAAVNIERLKVPASFTMAHTAKWFPDISVLPLKLKLLCAFPALLLTMLFYLDQNISVRAVNSCKLKKGESYHYDLMVLAVLVFFQSIAGLPWVCAATVQSLNHVRALSKTSTNAQTGQETFGSTIETRVTGFVIHTAILLSVFLLPIISHIPMPVVSGIFLYLGRKIMSGNLYFERLGDLFIEKKLLPPYSIYRRLSYATVLKFLGIQSLMLTLIWNLKQSKKLALVFPSCIGLLVITRKFLLGRLFKPEELLALDPPDE